MDKDIEQEIRKVVRKYLRKPKKVKKKRIVQSGGDSTYQDVVSGLNTATSAVESLRVTDIPAGGTSGSFTTLANNILGLVDNTINSVVNTVVFADQLVSLPSNLGKAYNEPIAQNNFTF